MQKIVAIVGPTATGKSDLAVALAHYIRAHARMFHVEGAEVLSADSRQVYRHLDIGTGKITPRETHGITHHLLDIADPRRVFTVTQYQKKAVATLRKLEKHHQIPIICGGTGLYIDAVLQNKQFPAVKPNPSLRKELEKLSTPELFKQLTQLDPRRAHTIDPRNPRRLIRALEIIHATGGPVPSLISTPSYEVLYIGIFPGKEIIASRIHDRLLRRIRSGMVTEARRLHEYHGLSWKRMEDLGLEYRYLSRFLQGIITKEQMLAQLESEIIDYAKRQMTWFRRNKDIIWIDKPDISLIQNSLDTFLTHLE